MKLQKLGGYAAIASVCFSIIYEIVQGPLTDFVDATKGMAALSASPTHVVVLSLPGIIAGILYLVMFLALHERMQADAPYLTRIMLIAASAKLVVSIIGTIGILIGAILIVVPAQDVSAFRALSAVGFGLYIMRYHIHGWACLLLGCAILKTRSFSRILGWLFLLTGIVYMPATIVPQPLQGSLLLVTAALLSVVATVWIGIALLRHKRPQPAAKTMAVS
jgi:hypothetical protein